MNYRKGPEPKGEKDQDLDLNALSGDELTDLDEDALLEFAELHGISIDMEELLEFRFVVSKLNDTDDSDGRLPGSKVELLLELARHARAELSTFGNTSGKVNGFDKGLCRTTYEKFKIDELDLRLIMDPASDLNGDWLIRVGLEPEQVGFIEKKTEFRPWMEIKEHDHQGRWVNTRRIRADETYPTPVHACRALHDLVHSHYQSESIG